MNISGVKYATYLVQISEMHFAAEFACVFFHYDTLELILPIIFHSYASASYIGMEWNLSQLLWATRERLSLCSLWASWERKWVSVPKAALLMFCYRAMFPCKELDGKSQTTYRQVSHISPTLVGNTIVDHSDVVGASPVGAAPTTSSFST